jgi:hypothetical protein
MKKDGSRCRLVGAAHSCVTNELALFHCFGARPSVSPFVGQNASVIRGIVVEDVSFLVAVKRMSGVTKSAALLTPVHRPLLPSFVVIGVGSRKKAAVLQFELLLILRKNSWP